MKNFGDSALVSETCSAWRMQGKKIAFVPTMGNLHDGHIALVKNASDMADRVVVSIFVNPLQFGENEDFAAYPRTLEQDADKLKACNVDLLFTPDSQNMYPHGMDKTTFVEVPDLSDILCGEFRPGHFRGVTTIVNKLFNIVQPDVAVFGKKDYQQLVIIERMVRDTAMPVKIIGEETVREQDGLAMSSRNSYLSPADRGKAPLIYAGLNEIRQSLVSGNADFSGLEQKMASSLKQASFKIDYISIRDAEKLTSATKETSCFVVLAAAWLGQTRLIDNVTCALNQP